MFALNPFITLPNCGPPPSLNHNNTLSDVPTYHLLSLLSAWSFFSLIYILKAKSKAKEIGRNCIPNNGEGSEEIVICPSLLDEKTCNDEDINNNMDKVSVLDVRTSSEGRLYNTKLSQVYYDYRSKNIAIEHINPLIQNVQILLSVRCILCFNFQRCGRKSWQKLKKTKKFRLKEHPKENRTFILFAMCVHIIL